MEKARTARRARVKELKAEWLRRGEAHWNAFEQEQRTHIEEARKVIFFPQNFSLRRKQEKTRDLVHSVFVYYFNLFLIFLG